LLNLILALNKNKLKRQRGSSLIHQSSAKLFPQPGTNDVRTKRRENRKAIILAEDIKMKK
jgi:hypothetical protein